VIARTRAEDSNHSFHAPSLPFAYSSGKLGDWYRAIAFSNSKPLAGDFGMH